MKAVLVLYDSLVRGLLPPYGCDWVKAPNFSRLAERTVTADKAYIGSMPCMPARRELHTGRHNFLHRGWGPLEPFDDSLPELLKSGGVYCHLASDHYHYWGDGGATYHTRYSSWEGFRGQEGDPWKGEVADPPIPDCAPTYKTRLPLWRQDWVNRRYLAREEDMPQVRTVQAGLDFLARNKDQDNWFLSLECFDPHEPFFTQEEYRALYPRDYDGPFVDWPDYGPSRYTDGQARELYARYAALVSMCDRYLGRVLDAFDEHGLWDDTMLIVTTDHGLLLSEHDMYGKNFMPFWDEVANIPFFAWDPKSRRRGVRCDRLIQAIDLAPTLLGYFGLPVTEAMRGVDLAETLARDAPTRDAAIFGIFGGQVNVTDGNYVYMLSPRAGGQEELYEYTLMPTRMHGFFKPEELAGASLAGPFDFTKGCRVLKVGNRGIYPILKMIGTEFSPTALYDRVADPRQRSPVSDPTVEARLRRAMVRAMRDHDAPPEQYARLGLEAELAALETDL